MEMRNEANGWCSAWVGCSVKRSHGPRMDAYGGKCGTKPTVGSGAWVGARKNEAKGRKWTRMDGNGKTKPIVGWRGGVRCSGCRLAASLSQRAFIGCPSPFSGFLPKFEMFLRWNSSLHRSDFTISCSIQGNGRWKLYVVDSKGGLSQPEQ